jgi:hypothetical protein
VWVRATDGDAASRVLVVYLLDFTYFYLYLVRCVQVVTRYGTKLCRLRARWGQEGILGKLKEVSHSLASPGYLTRKTCV